MHKRVIKCTLGTIDEAIKAVTAYRNGLEAKAKKICEKLASLGAMVASINFARAAYDGDASVNIDVEPTEKGYVITASGQAVAFIEFGAGAKYGGGYPLQTMEPHVDTNPGSWSTDPAVGKGHFDDPNGWYYAHGKKSWGNPPAMGMYYASKEMRDNVLRIAREVFAND